MINLIGNLFKFIKVGGKIIVWVYFFYCSNFRVEDGFGLVWVEIFDIGIGIDLED